MNTRSLLLALPLVLFACTAPVTPLPEPSSDGGRVGLTQHHDNDDFTVDFPSGWSMVEDKHVLTDRYEATGTAFIAPAEETTLAEALFQVAEIPGCPELVDADTVTENGVPWNVSNWSEGAAGTLYRGMSATTERANGLCTVVTGYTKSCNLGDACAPGHTTPFDQDKFDAIFSMMLQSLELKR